MALPRKLKYLNLFNDGLSYMGVVSSVTLPKLTRKLENYRGGGMNGAAPVDMGLDDDALSVEWTIGGFPMTSSGRSTPPPVLHRCRCAFAVLTSAMTPAIWSLLRLCCVAVTKSLILATRNRRGHRDKNLDAMHLFQTDRRRQRAHRGGYRQHG